MWLAGSRRKTLGRKLQAKAKKHNQFRVLADSKLNTNSDHISAALADGKISDEEFRLILSEVDKYNQMKEEILVAVEPRELACQGEKSELIRRGREQAMNTARSKLLGVLPLDILD